MSGNWVLIGALVVCRDSCFGFLLPRAALGRRCLVDGEALMSPPSDVEELGFASAGGLSASSFAWAMTLWSFFIDRIIVWFDFAILILSSAISLISRFSFSNSRFASCSSLSLSGSAT